MGSVTGSWREACKRPPCAAFLACVAAMQVVQDGAQIAPGMAEALLQRRLRVGGSPALASRAVLLCEALQAGGAAFQLAGIPGPPSGTAPPKP